MKKKFIKAKAEFIDFIYELLDDKEFVTIMNYNISLLLFCIMFSILS